MTESGSAAGQAQPVKKEDRHKILVVCLTVLTTVITAVVAGLQADANIRASTFNRDSQLYAILAAGELQRQGIQFTYDMNVFIDTMTDQQQATILSLTALQLEDSGEAQAAEEARAQAGIAQARADAARRFSVFFSDPRYAPASGDGMPDTQAYLDDASAAASDLVLQQNEAADQYQTWNRRGDAYTSVLALLAVAFFLFGLAQALAPQLRLIFAIIGLIALLGVGIWVLLILVV